MNTIMKIALVSAISFIFLAVFFLTVFLPAFNSLMKRVGFEIIANEKVYWSKFLYHPEAWNKVFENVSSIPEFWNATISSNLAEKSIPEVAAMFGANVFENNPEYAFCYISVPERNCQALNQTLREIGFMVQDIRYEKPLLSQIKISYF
jgi:hypothetical protein